MATAPVQLLASRWVVPVEPDNAVLEHAAVVVEGGVIREVTNEAEALRRYPGASVERFDRHVLIPGLVNAHTHAAMTLFRGYADDLPLMQWLNENIWPLEAKWVDEAFVRDGSDLAIAEMLTSGTTCFNDMYFFPEVTARCAQAAGIRAVVGLIQMKFPSPWAKSPDDYLAKALALAARFETGPLVRWAWAPHAPYTVEDAALQRLKAEAAGARWPVHIHLHETADEVAQAMAAEGKRPLQRLDALGVLDERFVAVHFTQVGDGEPERLAAAGAHVVHCPESNLKLASGFCPVDRLLKAGVNVALGTDGAASNNDLDLFGEMRTAALLAKGVAKDAAALPAHTALRMATLNGARALGLGEVIGSLQPGKSADLVAVSFDELALTPVFHPVSHLVYAASRRDVTDVWVAGERRVRGGQLLALETADVLCRAHAWEQRLRL